MNPSTLSDDDFYPLIEARHFDPFKLLGVREFQVASSLGYYVRMPPRWRSLMPRMMTVASLSRVHPDGLFEGSCAERTNRSTTCSR